MDIIKQQQKAEREEEERQRLEQEKRYRSEQEKLKQKTTTADEEKEEFIITKTECLVYICQCCNKMFKTTNAFQNHTMSKKHKDAARLYEEAGVIVTEVVLADDLIEEHGYDEEEENIGGEGLFDPPLHKESNRHGEGGYDSETGGKSEEEDGGGVDDEEEEEETEKVRSLFSALAAFSDCSSSSSSSAESSDEEEEKDCTTSSELQEAAIAVENDGWEDDLDLLEDIIYQNILNERLYPDDFDGDDASDEEKAVALAPVVFDDEQYDPDNFNADRLAAVQHRLQKRYVNVS